MPWNTGGPPNGPPNGSNGEPDDTDPDRRPSPWGKPSDGEPEPPRPTGPRSVPPAGNGGTSGGRGPGQRPPGGGGGPWGLGGFGGGSFGNGGARRPSGSGTPPNLDDLLAKAQGIVRNLFDPSGNGGGGSGRGGRPRGRSVLGGGRGFALVGILVVGAWLASGFYRVQPDEEGVVKRFGAFQRTTPPGLNYHLPYPIETVETPAVTRVNRVEVGYRVSTPDSRLPPGRDVAPRDVPEESLMLTGDENIVDTNFAVFWRIRDAGAFLFNTRNPGYTVKSAAESVMREVIGRTPIQPALTDARAQIEQSVKTGMQSILDQYGTGVEITQVQLQRVDPPAAVIDSFRDVQRANTDADRMRNEAQSYHNDIVPRARGDAARLVAEADAQRQASVAESNGQAQRFLSVLKAYDAAKDVTLQRLYIETMQDILSHTPAVIVDDKLQGIVPYLPLGDVGGAARPTNPPAPPSVVAPFPGPQASRGTP